MLLAAILLLATAAVLARRVAGTFVYPPALFCGAWACLLAVIYVSGRTFFSISTPTLALYVVLAYAFALGGVVMTGFRRMINRTPASESARRYDRARVRRFLDVAVILLTAAFPWFVRYIQQQVQSGGPSFLWAVRVALLEYDEENAGRAISLISNLVPLSILVAFWTYYEDDGTLRRRLRTWFAILLSLGFNLMTGGRVGATILLAGLVGIRWMRNRRALWKLLVSIGLVFMVVFVLIDVAVQKGDTRLDSTIRENLPSIAVNLEAYSAGALVAFDRYFSGVEKIPPAWHINREFIRVARKFGANIPLGSLHAEFSTLGPNTVGNVYTAYFAYVPDFGVPVTVLLVFVLGGVVTLVYWVAANGNPQAVMVSAVLFTAILLSGYYEEFFLGLNFLVKTLVFSTLLYQWPRIISALRRCFPSTASPVIGRGPGQ